MNDGAATRGDDHRFRQERRQRIRELRGQGATRTQIALEFASTHGVTRLLAFRWAYDLTLMEAADCYNDVAGDAEARMSASSLSRYENWPHGARAIQPRVGMLHTFAQVYHCAPGDLLGGIDYTDQREPTAATALATTEDRANTQTSRYPGGAAAPEPLQEGTEDHTNRREAVKAMGAALLIGATRTRRLLHAAESPNVGPLTLAEYDDTVWWLSRNVGYAPLATLVATADQTAEDVASLLDGRHSGQAHLHLELLTGQLAYLQGLFAFRLGEHGIAQTHLRLARHYGEQLYGTRGKQSTTATLLLASVAEVETYLALYQGHFDTALRIVRKTHPYGTEHTTARLEILEARARAALGSVSHKELAGLLEHAEAALPARPSFEPGASAPFGPESFMLHAATAYNRAGHERAEQLAREAVQRYETLEAQHGERYHYEHVALARLELAMALLQAKRPEPEEAARLGAQALAVPSELQNDPVKRRTVELLTMFGRQATLRDLPAVKQLADMARGYGPPALPAPPSRPALGSS